MAQNITTLLDKDPITANDVNGSDVLYLVHGSGSNRSRKLSVEELKKVVSHNGDVKFDSIEMHKSVTGGASADVEFDGEKLKMSATPAGVTDSGVMEMTRLGIECTSSPQSGGQNKNTFGAGGVEVSFTDSNNNKTATEVEYDHVTTTKVIADEIQGSTPVDVTKKKLVVDSSVEIGKNGSNLGNNLVVHGTETVDGDVTVKGNLTVGVQGQGGSETLNVLRQAYMRAGLNVRDITPIGDDNGPKHITIGGAPVGNDPGGVRLVGYTVAQNGIAQSMQDIQTDAQGHPISGHLISITGGSLLFLTPDSIGVDIDLTSELAGAALGQRFTIALQLSIGEHVNLGVGATKSWKMKGMTACDFVVVQASPSLKLYPLGCGEWNV